MLEPTWSSTVEKSLNNIHEISCRLTAYDALSESVLAPPYYAVAPPHQSVDRSGLSHGLISQCASQASYIDELLEVLDAQAVSISSLRQEVAEISSELSETRSVASRVVQQQGEACSIRVRDMYLRAVFALAEVESTERASRLQWELNESGERLSIHCLLHTLSMTWGHDTQWLQLSAGRRENRELKERVEALTAERRSAEECMVTLRATHSSALQKLLAEHRDNSTRLESENSKLRAEAARHRWESVTATIEHESVARRSVEQEILAQWHGLVSTFWSSSPVRRVNRSDAATETQRKIMRSTHVETRVLTLSTAVQCGAAQRAEAEVQSVAPELSFHFLENRFISVRALSPIPMLETGVQCEKRQPPRQRPAPLIPITSPVLGHGPLSSSVISASLAPGGKVSITPAASLITPLISPIITPIITPGPPPLVNNHKDPNQSNFDDFSEEELNDRDHKPLPLMKDFPPKIQEGRGASSETVSTSDEHKSDGSPVEQQGGGRRTKKGRRTTRKSPDEKSLSHARPSTSKKTYQKPTTSHNFDDSD